MIRRTVGEYLTVTQLDLCDIIHVIALPAVELILFGNVDVTAVGIKDNRLDTIDVSLTQ